MMNKVHISVIVPIYKVEKYLPKCIDSILAQTNKNFELLLINDGSPDDCAKICDEYATKDSRIRVFHKENGGVSSARNLGLDNAVGDWVSFVDPDDWVSADYFEVPQDFINVDVIQKTFYTIQELDGQIRTRSIINKNDIYQAVNSAAIYYINHRRNGALWDKLISRRVIGDRRFDANMAIGEDTFFFMSILNNVRAYAQSSAGAYNYLIRSDSALGKVNNSECSYINQLFKLVEGIQSVRVSGRELYLYQGLLHAAYTKALFNLRREMNNEQLKSLKLLSSSINFDGLRYLTLKNKIKLMMIRIYCIIGS